MFYLKNTENLVFCAIKYKMKMNEKNLLVSFLVIASVLVLVATVSAAEITTNYTVKVDGTEVVVDGVVGTDNVSVVAGELATIKVYFTADVNDVDVTVKAEIEGNKDSNEVKSSVFDVEAGERYSKTLTLKVPFELKEDVSDDVTLRLVLDGSDHKSELPEVTLRVQRPSYNVDFKSVSVPQTVEAGETFPVDVVLKNLGYNDLEDLYVTAKISALDVEKTAYLGDLVALELNDEDEDTVNSRIYLEVPYDAVSGVYTLEVTVTNDDTTSSVVKQIVVKNDFASNVIATAVKNTAEVGENAEYSFLIVNPTNKLKVYSVVAESSGSLTTSLSESVVAVPAGSSHAVKVTASADTEGEYNFNVKVLSGEELVSNVALNLTAKEGRAVTNPVVVLTVILGVIFLVLLAVLVVLIGKKPEKAEEFGESYY